MIHHQVSGFVLLNKPKGMASRACVDEIKKVFNVKHAGHSGTLDINASGLILIALGEARKLMPILMGLEKEYFGIIHLHKKIDRYRIENALKGFKGEIIQIPPKRSAVKRKARKRYIYSIEILKISGKDLYFKIRCDAGVYIRKLVSDFGKVLGVGAHLSFLKRTGIGVFSIEECINLNDIKRMPEKFLIPIENVLERLGVKRIIVKKDGVNKIKNGAPLLSKWVRDMDDIKRNEIVTFFYQSRPIALGISKIDKKDLPFSKIVAKTERVLFPKQKV